MKLMVKINSGELMNKLPKYSVEWMLTTDNN